MVRAWQALNACRAFLCLSMQNGCQWQAFCMFNFISTLDNKCHFATVGRRRGIYFFIFSKEELVMKQEELCQQLAWQIRKFADLVKTKKRNGGMRNA